MEMLTGKGNPSKYLKAEIGAHYKNTETGDVFECVIAKDDSPMHGKLIGGYVWKKVARGEHMEVCAGGSGEGGGVKMFVITSKCDENTGESSATANMTYDELTAALLSGDAPVAIWHDGYLEAGSASWGYSQRTFQTFMNDGDHVTLKIAGYGDWHYNSDGTLNMCEAEPI